MENFEFFENVAQLIEESRRYVGRTTDLTMCVTYFEIGRMIFEEEQGGKARAAYGKKLLANLSAFLKKRVGRGYSETNLRNARKFYKIYSPSIQQTPSAELESKSNRRIQQTSSAEFQKGQTLLAFLEEQKKNPKSHTELSQLYPFIVGWSLYLILMRIDNEQERRFYEIEAAKQQWSYKKLQREYGSSLYERVALSRDKEAVMELSKAGQIVENPSDVLKNPLVLEFLNMEEHSAYSEDDLESAILTKLTQFLSELGKGFLFEARQKRFTFNEKHFKVDLVCYNRLLRCYILIDLKTKLLEHKDLGQMQMYVHYYDRYVKQDDENPTVGILLCKEKDDAIVELTLPEGENIYASQYSLYLPDKTLLQSKLAEWIEEYEEYKELRRLTNEGDDGNID